MDRLVMPEEVTVIADRAFAKNKSLKHADLRNVRYIGAHAFQECSNLETVIMSRATVIGAGAFEFCRSLISVDFSSVTEVGEAAFSFCGMLDIPEMPASITSVGASAFSHTAIRRADLSWLDEIPAYLFGSCTSLEYADVSGAKVIGPEAFEDCRSLSYIRIDSAEKIGAKALHGCELMKFAVLPESLREIGDGAFWRVEEGLLVPRSVRQIGRNCFGPVDVRKSIRIYRSALYEFRNYFPDDRIDPFDADEHFYLWESSIDVTVLDDETDEVTGFLPLFSDLYISMRKALPHAFRPDNTFDYSVLDTVFYSEMRWNQKGKDRLVVRRSMYPYELAEPARTEYSDYLRKHSERIAKRAVSDRDIGVLAFLFDNELIGKDSITGILDYSIAQSASECTAFLLERQSEMSTFGDALFDEL